jgi:ornithine decarboxylase
MTPKIARFLAEQQPATPCLVLDVDRVEDNFRALRARCRWRASTMP